ncbi:gp436 family protein [Limnobaculum xujianqingii]|uniref:gp436 family protein n=1 Tax=Limnobaculum xujianqingii TaxID=2738837 RepID=UPI00112C26D0|nr:phage protein Gp36 family protein [Limnobaculum xujianqingii]
MSYATGDDMVTTFGERECISLTDHNHTGEIDQIVMDNALSRASAEIDGYLVGRYATPWPDAPRILVGRCCDIARYQLASAERTLSDEIKLRYDDAIRFLVQVASGKISLGRTDTGSVIQGSSQVKIYSGSRQFGRDSTGGGAF